MRSFIRRLLGLKLSLKWDDPAVLNTAMELALAYGPVRKTPFPIRLSKRFHDFTDDELKKIESEIQLAKDLAENLCWKAYHYPQALGEWEAIELVAASHPWLNRRNRIRLHGWGGHLAMM